MTQENTTVSKPAAIRKLYIKNGKSYFKFKKGVEIIIKPVSPALLNEVQKIHPKPPVPKVNVAVGDGTFMEEENPSDPKYQRDLAAWGTIVEDDWADLLLELGVELTGPLSQAAIDETERVKAFMLKRFQVDLTTKGDGSNEQIYVRFVLPSSEEELGELISALMGRSQPEEGAIAKAIEDFSGNV